MRDWIKWEGGECPVDEEAVVEVRFRGSGERSCSSTPAGSRCWDHQGAESDIVAYRVMEPEKELFIASAAEAIEVEDKERDLKNLVESMNSALQRKQKTNPYSKYFKDVSDLDSVDTYELNRLFPVDDPTGCILHARKKLLLPAVRTGGKTLEQEVREARDTLNRWLEINGGGE